jgi:hypothetical protein
VLFAVPFASRTTLTRVAPSAQSNLADVGLATVRSDSWPSGSHLSRCDPFANASKSQLR